jgi:ABC-type dipeptide/oligopeptide/nickel transport system permease component
MLILIILRLIREIPSLICVSIIFFSLAHISPGGPTVAMLGPKADAELMEKSNKDLDF